MLNGDFYTVHEVGNVSRNNLDTLIFMILSIIMQRTKLSQKILFNAAYFDFFNYYGGIMIGNNFALKCILVLLLLNLPFCYGEILVEPHGFAKLMEDEEPYEHTTTLTNAGEQAVNFEIGIDVRDLEEGRLANGPRRDQPEGRILNWHSHLNNIA